jgi:amidase
VPTPTDRYSSATASRRRFLAAGLSGGIAAVLTTASAVQAADQPFELAELSIADLQEGLKTGKFTSRALAEKYLARIEAIDRSGPKLNSVIELNPDALDLADALDRERKDKGPRGPLHGIPILVKDNIDTADKMATTAGSLALAGAPPPKTDAFLVQQLRKAGALILGKTNLSEWANIRSSQSTSGWSGRGGLTRNPWALDRNTSGSSSGSGAAVAANLCAAAIGTETNGSIVSPSSVCGLVGIKPTVGLVSRTGVIPISHTQDTAGPMTRTVRDAAIVLGALTGIDPEDEVTSASLGKVPDYTRSLDAAGLRGARIGVARNFFGFHDGVERVMDEALAALKQAGATLVDPAAIPSIGAIGPSENFVLLYELKAGLAAYFARRGKDCPMQTLADVIAFNDKHRDRELAHFGQDLFLKSQGLGPLTDKVYLDALATCRRLSRTEGIDAVMNEHRLDALVAPTEGPAWVTDLVVGDRFLGASSTAAAAAGYPSITVPAGYVSGLPAGLSFFGRAWSEPLLIKLAYSFEQATRWRREPKFLPTLPSEGGAP